MESDNLVIDGKKFDYLPASAEDQLRAKPIYKSFTGWKSSTVGIEKFEDLPDNAKSYIKAIQTFIDVPITFISVGPERTENIII